MAPTEPDIPKYQCHGEGLRGLSIGEAMYIGAFIAVVGYSIGLGLVHLILS